jgi:hypothetical protein
MTEPNRLPLRVLVKGASTVVYTSWMSGPRSDMAWPRVVEEQLYAAGYPAEVRCTAMPAERTRQAIRTWQEEVLAWSPDVIWLNYGQMECVHLFLPRWFERHANSVKGRPMKGRMFYRKRILRPVWTTLASLQRAIDARVPPNMLSYKRRRVYADLQRYIERVRTVASPLVLIPDIIPPGKPYQKWFPGEAARCEAMTETLRQLVADLDEPDIRMFESQAVINPLLAPGEDAHPDGGHLTPPLHRAMGEAVADVIIEWASHQTHLDLDAAEARQAQRARSRLSRTAD